MSRKVRKADYGNWVSANMMKAWLAGTIVAGVLCAASFFAPRGIMGQPGEMDSQARPVRVGGGAYARDSLLFYLQNSLLLRRKI